MKRKWTTLKKVIASYESKKNLYLTLINEEGRIVCANANMIKTMHLQNPRKQTISFFDLLHPAHSNIFKAAVRASSKNNRPSGMELYLKNGSYHPMKWDVNYVGEEFASPIFLCVGQQVSYQQRGKQFTDSYQLLLDFVGVSENKRVPTRLRDREALFNEFMTQTPNLSWVVDEFARLVFASKSFFQFFNLDPVTSIDKKMTDLLPPLAAKSLFTKHISVFETAEPAQFIEKVQWANGSNYVFHVNLFPIKGTTSRKMLGGSAVNLADKFEAERKLREMNERLLLLTGASSDAIWEWDMQSGQIFRNDALMNIIGYTHDNPKGLSWWLRRIHPDDRNRVRNKVKETTKHNLQSWQDKYRFKCADGYYKYMQDKGYIVYENELPVKMIGCLQDVTGLKELEEQLTEEKLHRQKEISETVIRVQEKERTRIGHELHDNVNQILSTVKLFVDMLKPSKKEEKLYKEKTVEYLMLAIEEIRKLSKELVVPQLTKKGLVDSIYTLAEDVQLTTGINIKFTHDHENDLLSHAKKITLFRIMQEQLKNIINHSKATQVEIFLQRKDNITQLIVLDNGIGFDSGQTHRGIGLSNIYERTRFYNGNAEIESSPGKGCTLRVSIPGL